MRQSCGTYKTVVDAEIKKGKYYEIKLDNGQRFETKCQRVDHYNILVTINKKVMEMPKTKTQQEKEKLLV